VTRDYQCAEVAVTAVYHGEGPVDLTFLGKALSLPHVVSGSGARCTDDKGNEFWSKGEEAMLTIAGQQMRKCTPASVPTAAKPSAGNEYPAARDACVAAVAKGTGIDASKLTVTEVLWAQAGVGVTIQVPGSQAPWSCLSDEKGHVQGVRPIGSDGAAR
jgi:hypothetical protein